MARFLYYCSFTVLILLTTGIMHAQTRSAKLPFIKGIYGNPGTLLKAGYRFDSLGMNAVFVRSISLTPEFFQTAKQQGCRVYVEFPTLNGKEYLKVHPEAWPVDEKGNKAEAADWFMGICPTDSAFKQYRVQQLKDILSKYAVDGIFLDYFHLHAQFETPDPILPETCFCERCTRLFGKYIRKKIPGQNIKQRATWILQHEDTRWRKWRSSVLNQWAADMDRVVKSIRKNALTGIYHCAWYPDDHDSALYRNLGIDVRELAKRADVLSPMLFHRMTGRPPSWVSEYGKWLNTHLSPDLKKKTRVWPIVQAHNKPGIISPQEFLQVMQMGSQPPYSGVMMFSDQSLIEDREKIEVMRKFYLLKKTEEKIKL